MYDFKESMDSIITIFKYGKKANSELVVVLKEVCGSVAIYDDDNNCYAKVTCFTQGEHRFNVDVHTPNMHVTAYAENITDVFDIITRHWRDWRVEEEEEDWVGLTD